MKIMCGLLWTWDGGGMGNGYVVMVCFPFWGNVIQGDQGLCKYYCYVRHSDVLLISVTVNIIR